jgi:homoserine O-acetyltransferase/O-succinyltransferase
MTDGTGVFELGNVELQSGEVLEDARLVYATFGKLAPARDNVVLFPTYYTGTHRENTAMIGNGRALDPERHFIVIPNMFGNGVSSSPSNHERQRGPAFPRVSVFDNVHCHRRLLEEVFGVNRVALAFGWSMGAQQAYHFAALFPSRVDALLAVCGSARTSAHNWVFLEGVKAALLADPDFDGGSYTEPPKRGLAAFGRVYAGWAYSQTFFRNGQYRELGYESPGALLDGWAREHEAWDANDLLAMLYAWEHADISDNSAYEGDYARALGAITARTIVMPTSTDLYFPKEDSALEVSHLKNGELRVIETDWGHVGGGPNRNRDATAVVERAIADLLHA